MSQTLDMRGKTITTYTAFQAAKVLRDMDDGSVLELRANETEAIDTDLRAWCQATGNRLLSAERDDAGRRYRIKKHTMPPHGRSLALVVSDAGLEELLSPLGFALAAALEGTEVSIYFQGPAVKVLTKNFKAKLHGVNRPFSRFARRGLEKAGHVAPQEKVAQLRQLGARLYICGPSMEHFGVARDDLLYDDVIVAEYLTFMAVIGQADIHLIVQ
jgi:predicted peroxiredoxin/TusA-related sulfurtransferase